MCTRLLKTDSMCIPNSMEKHKNLQKLELADMDFITRRVVEIGQHFLLQSLHIFYSKDS